MSAPNQKKIVIEASKEKPFLKIGDTEWKEAFKQLTLTQFGVYLYLAGNMEGYVLELSPTAIKNELGISPSSYHRAIDKLTELKYINEIDGKLIFSPYPKKIKLSAKSREQIVKQEKKHNQTRNTSYSGVNREINNKIINKTNKIDSALLKEALKLGFKQNTTPDGQIYYTDDVGKVYRDYYDIIEAMEE